MVEIANYLNGCPSKEKKASLLIAPSRILPCWEKELGKEAPKLVTKIYSGTAENRRQIATQLVKQKFDVLLTSFEYASRDNAQLSEIHWKCIFVDERFRLKSQSCKLTKVLIRKYQNAELRFLLTEKAMQENLPDSWSGINYLTPEKYDGESFEKFFNAEEPVKLRLNRKETQAAIKCLQLAMKPFLKMIADNSTTGRIDRSILNTIKCDMSFIQKKIYMNIKKGEEIFPKKCLVSVSELKTKQKVDKLTQLRKICNHPFMFDEVE
ncbi:probable global transcription activator SNF2L2 [Uloborus diversus]|uniref:probable global transcription activator SNF2L2 n=1 Tax=Uloborus diversus TaxID=327109 RepID=UPI002409DB33|nr:probable global transcription activator SNF2L2 [Uloborus diversus]